MCYVTAGMRRSVCVRPIPVFLQRTKLYKETENQGSLDKGNGMKSGRSESGDHSYKRGPKKSNRFSCRIYLIRIDLFHRKKEFYILENSIFTWITIVSCLIGINTLLLC